MACITVLGPSDVPPHILSRSYAVAIVIYYREERPSEGLNNRENPLELRVPMNNRDALTERFATYYESVAHYTGQRLVRGARG